MLPNLLLLLAVGQNAGGRAPLVALPQGWPVDERPIDAKLFAAVRAGDEPRVRDLLRKGANPNGIEANGWTPLTSLIGTEAGALAIAKDLVAKGANVKYRQPDQGSTPLQMAAQAGNRDLAVFYLEKDADPNIATTDGATPLTFAVRSRSLEVVRLLITRGASLVARTTGKNVRLTDDRGWEPGFRLSGQTPAFALAESFSPSVAEYLVKAGANLNATDDNGWTILHFATKYGEFEAMKWLVHHGVNANAASKRGYRPLHLVGSMGIGVPSVEPARILLDAGADPKLKNDAGQTPLDLLRVNVAWLLRSSSPAIGQQPEFENRYLEQVNALARLFDPKALPIGRPAAVLGAYGRVYEPLRLLDDVVVRRWVRREGDRAILRLQLDPPATSHPALKIQKLWLHSFEPLNPGPFLFSVVKGKGSILEISYPAAAAKGGDIDMTYSFGSSANGSGGGSVSEASRNIAFVSGASLQIQGDVADRTMIVRFISVQLGGRTLKKFTGMTLTLRGAAPVSTGIPSKIGNTGLAHLDLHYEIRIPPNKTWEEHAISL